MALINVSDKIRAMFDQQARKVCETSKLKLDAYNQDANAMATFRALKELGVEIPAEKTEEVLQVLKKAGNASANRQALCTEKKKAEGSAASAMELLKQLEEQD